MYIQHLYLVTPTENITVDSYNVSERLKVQATQLNEREPYKTVKRGEPTMQENPISNINESVTKQWKHGIIHALGRMMQDASILKHQSKMCHLLMDTTQFLVNFLL